MRHYQNIYKKRNIHFMKKKQKEFKSQFIYDQLKEQIVTHELKQGAPLSERMISKQFDASRTPVRQALQRLQKEHFIDLTPEYGAFVSRITHETILEVYEIREVLEGLSAKLCAMYLQDSERDELLSIHQALCNTLSIQSYQKATVAELEFHRFIIFHTKNHMLNDIMQMIADHGKRITRLIKYTEEWSEKIIRQHYNITHAIITGECDAAEKFMREHIRSARDRQLTQITRWQSHKK